MKTLSNPLYFIYSVYFQGDFQHVFAFLEVNFFKVVVISRLHDALCKLQSELFRSRPDMRTPQISHREPMEPANAGLAGGRKVEI